jgi:flagellar assembly protein FliH
MIIKKQNQKLREVKHVDEPLVDNGVVDVETSVVEDFSGEDSAQEEHAPKQEVEPELFDIENIDFTQRQERRRGSRRRGYRRIDDRNLVSRAQEESENIKKSAFEEGYRQGLEQASKDIENFKDELTNFMNARSDVFEYIAPDILEISVDIAKKIIKKELEADPQVLINTIVDVLKTVSKNEPKITIKVKPQAVQFIKDTIPNITYQYGIEAKISIVADPSIEDGGCVFQTNNGIVDASIDTQLEIIKKALEGM